MSTATTVRTHCPNCGAKLHRTDLSLCAYCATPLGIADARQPADPAVVERLQRMRQHKSYAAAMEFVPPDQTVERRAGRLLSLGTVTVAAGLLVGGLGALAAGGELLAAGPLIGGALVLVGLVTLSRPAALRAAHRKAPMLKRPAIVAQRRSETSLEGAVTYHFTLRFDDGSEGEFVWPGQGTMYEPLSNGYTGVAYTRGADLVDFRRLT